MLPPIPSLETFALTNSWTRTVLNGKIFISLTRQFVLYRSTTGLENPLPGRFHIYSPDTGEDYTLPEAPPLPFPVKRLEFEDYNDCYFGFDTLSNEHKVLLVQTLPDSQNPLNPLKRLFWVFTRSSGSWSRIHPFPPEQVFGFPKNEHGDVIFANGAIHCIYDPKSGPSDKYILAFDMSEGQLRKIPYPDDSFPGELTQFGGYLALIENSSFFPFGSRKGLPGVEYDKLQLWILKDYKNLKWVKETIHLPFGWMKYNLLLAFDYNTGEMFLKPEVNRRFTEYFIYYNTKTGTIRHLEATGFPRWCKESVHAYVPIIEVNFDDKERQKSF